MVSKLTGLMTLGYGEFRWPRQGLKTANENQELKKYTRIYKYHICSHNLPTFFFILAAEKSVCVKYVDFFCGGLDLVFILA
jgi:hypothetical protein